jgi:hypothetical protein
MLVCTVLPPLPYLMMVVVVRAGAKPLIPDDTFSIARPYVITVVPLADIYKMMPVGLRLLRRKS